MADRTLTTPTALQKLVVVLPALNEEATIHDVVSRIPRRIEGIDALEILVVDDGSSDRTAALARAAGAEVLSFSRHRGLGEAVARGLEWALNRRADVVVNIDSDGQFDPADIPKLIAPILRGEADFVTCTRFSPERPMTGMPVVKRLGNRLISRLVNLVCDGQRFTDVCCGFRAYSRETLLQLNLFSSYCYNEETFIALADKEVRIVELPLRVLPVRPKGKSRLISSVWRYAFEIVPILLRTTRDLMPLKFFGVPGLLLLLLGSLLGLWVIGWWLMTRETYPFTSFLTGSGTFLILGFLMIVLALVADMIGRVRRTQERVLYLLRKQSLQDPAQRGTNDPESH